MNGRFLKWFGPGALTVVATFGMLSVMAGGAALAQEGQPEPMLSHDVFFKLNDNSDASVKSFVAECKKYLTGHPGTVWFAAGPLAKELARDVNDRDFDVALHIVFVNKAAQDAYQTADRHVKFAEENKPKWSKVRVFDSYVTAFAHGNLEVSAK